MPSPWLALSHTPTALAGTVSRRVTHASCRLGEFCDDLDLELEAVEPRHADAGQRWVGRLAPMFPDHLPDRLELRFANPSPETLQMPDDV